MNIRDRIMQGVPSEHKKMLGDIASKIKVRNAADNVMDWFKDSETEQVKLLGSDVKPQDKAQFLAAMRGLKPIFTSKDGRFETILRRAMGTTGSSCVSSLSEEDLTYAKGHVIGMLGMTGKSSSDVCRHIHSLSDKLSSAYNSRVLSETLVTVVMDLYYAASVIESIIEK